MKSKSLWIIASAACLTLFALQYGSTNIDKIMSARGDYYYAKNDSANAQKYYESAFELGVEDTDRRDRYVNLLINSPMTVKSQEKLVKFINLPADDGAKLKAEYFIYDLKRAISAKYPGNYIKKAVYNGKIVRWSKLPITYGLKSDEPIPQYFIDEIEDAFKTWEKESNQLVYFERTTKNPNIVIDFKAHNPADPEEGQKYIVAFTTPGINSENKLMGMKIDFYLRDNEDKYFSKNQVYNTALHEIVHALGFMGHSDNRKDIMYMAKDAVSVNEDLREEPTEADINTVKLLYNIKPDITNGGETPSEYIPYVVLGNDKEVTNVKIREAKAYIKRAPNLPMGYVDLAMGYAAALDYLKAIKNLNKALELADTNDMLGIIYYNLAVCYYHINDFEAAKENIRKSIQIKEAEDKNYLLAEIYTKEGNIDQAIEEYGSLMKKRPKNIEYTIALANIYIRKHEYMNARKVLKAYFQANPEDKGNPRLAPYGIVRLGL